MFSKKKGPPSGKPLYPTQSSTAGASPAQPAQPPPYNYDPSVPSGAPPPPYAPQQQFAGGPVYGQPYAQPYGQPYGVPVAQPHYVMQPAPSTVVVHGGFDAGARFDGISRPNVPPPPPGCIPNTAQLAAAQGCNLVMTQRPTDLFTGGSDGGYTMF